MNAASWIAVTTAFLRDNGQPVTLRRVTGTQQIPMDVEVTAVVRGYQPQDVAGTVMQGDRTVVLSNQEIAARRWPGPPQGSDRVLIGDEETVVMTVETIQIGDTVIRHNLVVRG